MTYCGKCGAQLQGDERFCVSCGAEVIAQTASTSAPAPTSAPPAPVQPIPVAPTQAAAAPVPHAAPVPIPGQVPGSIPVIVGMPPVPQPKSGGKMWMVVVAIAILVGGYYYQKQHPATPAQPVVQGQPGQPGQPGQQPAPGQPGQQPAPEQPGAYPVQQPGTPGQSENNAALVRMQMFGGRWDAVNGNVQISQARWTNNANVIVQSATLECVQYAANGGVLTQMQTRLNGPVQPQGTSYFNVFLMGPMAPNLAKVNCGIVGVTPAGQ